jgi:hypothetical protein
VSIDVSRRWEAAVTAVVALAVLFGGRYLLVALSHAGAPAALMVAAIAGALLFGLWQRRSSGVNPLGLTRDVALLAAALFAVAYIAVPARWSSGAAIASAEFGLILHGLSLLVPGERTA